MQKGNEGCCDTPTEKHAPVTGGKNQRKIDFSRIRTVGLLGFGSSNRGAYEYLRRKYPHLEFILRDEGYLGGNKTAAKQVLHNRSQEGEFIRCYFGTEALRDINEELILLSPSVRREREEIEKIRESGTVLSSDLEIFLSEYCGELICVSGSDGKSTTTYLISEMLKLSGYPAVPSGNFGLSLCSLLGTPSLPVIELSSFQLSYALPEADIAAVTNITKNHLDWHKSFEEYKNAKLSLIRGAKRAVIDSDCPILLKASAECRTFCACSTRLAYKELCKLLFANYYITADSRSIYINEEPTIPVSAIKRREEYNLKNMLLAIGMTLGNATPCAIYQAVSQFRGLPHRAELVAEHKGIRYINSSIDTTPERTVSTLSHTDAPCIVIIGGKSKRLSLEKLLISLKKNTAGAILLGEVGYELTELIRNDESLRDYPHFLVEDLYSAIKLGREKLTRGGTLLLSPAATSYDRYRSYEERGEDFRRQVQRLIDSED